MVAYLQDAITWIVTEINNDATIDSLGSTGVYMYSAPEGAAYPYVIIGKLAGGHDLTFCGAAYDTHYLAIKCVDRSFDGGNRARTIVDRIREVIENRSATLPTGRLLDIQPNNSYEYDEQESGNNNFFHCVVSEKVILS